MTNYAQHLNRPPSPKQLAYQKSLEEQRRVSLSPPRTSAQASRNIKALLAVQAPPAEDFDHELRELREDLATGSGAVALVREDEIGGYGSTAHWRY